MNGDDSTDAAFHNAPPKSEINETRLINILVVKEQKHCTCQSQQLGSKLTYLSSGFAI